jgi:hypothetical protein
VQPVTRLTIPQTLLGQFVPGNVARDAEQAHHHAIQIEHRAFADLKHHLSPLCSRTCSSCVCNVPACMMALSLRISWLAESASNRARSSWPMISVAVRPTKRHAASFTSR